MVNSFLFGCLDCAHGQWNDLLASHVRWIRGGTASQVDYAGFKTDRAPLKDYLDELSSISRKAFDAW